MSLDHGQERLARQAAARGLPVREVARAIGADVEEVRRAWSRLTAREIFGAKPKLQPGEYAEGSASTWVPKLAVIPTRLTCTAIGKIVARYYMLPDAAMHSIRRPRSMSRPRQVAFYLCRELTGASYPEIGRRFGGRDHTTVMHGDKMTRIRLETDGKLRADIDALTATIRAQYATRDSAADGFPQAGEGI